MGLDQSRLRQRAVAPVLSSAFTSCFDETNPTGTGAGGGHVTTCRAPEQSSSREQRSCRLRSVCHTGRPEPEPEPAGFWENPELGAAGGVYWKWAGPLHDIISSFHFIQVNFRATQALQGRVRGHLQTTWSPSVSREENLPSRSSPTSDLSSRLPGSWLKEAAWRIIQFRAREPHPCEPKRTKDFQMSCSSDGFICCRFLSAEPNGSGTKDTFQNHNVNHSALQGHQNQAGKNTKQ